MGRTEWLFRLTAGRDIGSRHDEHERIVWAVQAGYGALALVSTGREPSLAILADIFGEGS
ncbi:hypothetical protein ACFWBV_18860 [Streptomyces sp. NPDC060030]|uniref:hypothetical protein n=1 Tax=Streptomyces sp. NPDC060030 TaxID=3347042 RepID=UPI003683E108